MKIKALKTYKWKYEDLEPYVDGQVYDEDEPKALEMVQHGYAEAVDNVERKKFDESEKETKVLHAEENKKSKKSSKADNKED